MKTIVDIHKELIGHEKLAEKLDEVKSYLSSIGLEVEPFQLRAQYAITSGKFCWKIAESDFSVAYNLVISSAIGKIHQTNMSCIRYWKKDMLDNSNYLAYPELSSFCYPIQAFIIYLEKRGFELRTIRDVGNNRGHDMLYGYLTIEKDGLSVEVNFKEMK